MIQQIQITVHHMDGVYPVKTKHFQAAVFNSYRYRSEVVLVQTM